MSGSGGKSGRQVRGVARGPSGLSTRPPPSEPILRRPDQGRHGACTSILIAVTLTPWAPVARPMSRTHGMWVYGLIRPVLEWGEVVSLVRTIVATQVTHMTIDREHLLTCGTPSPTCAVQAACHTHPHLHRWRSGQPVRPDPIACATPRSTHPAGGAGPEVRAHLTRYSECTNDQALSWAKSS
jgi:hypothetical protein